MAIAAKAPRLGISRCLLGAPVRYNGGHKLDRFIRDTLGRHVQFVAVCPEVECGLAVPREPMRLIGDPAAPQLLTVDTHHDHTERMLVWTRHRLLELAGQNLSGFIFKKNSPSCGIAGVKIYNDKGLVVKNGSGLFAKAFITRFPALPIADEESLRDQTLRETFINRLLCRE